MKLRIEEQVLRFRISVDELNELCLGKLLSLSLNIAPNIALHINAQTKQQEAVLDFHVNESNNASLFIQNKAATALQKSLPSREGLTATKDLNTTHTLTLSLEVDIRTQSRKKRRPLRTPNTQPSPAPEKK